MIRIYNRFLDFVDELDRFQSLQFRRDYHGVGEFELHVNRYMHGADALEKGHLIAIEKQKDRVGVILTKEVPLDENGKETEVLKLTGYTLEGLIRRRITVPPVHTSHDRKTGPAEDVMKHYIRKNFVEPEDPNRVFPNLIIAASRGRGEKVEWESRYRNVAEEIEKISIQSGLGWGLFADFRNKRIVFDVLEGKDRTQNNPEGNSPVFFSPEFETIKSQTFVDSDVDLRTVGYVGGQGEGVDRRIVTVGVKTGWERIEEFVDARDLGGEGEEEEELTPEQEEALLTERGQSKLSELVTLQSLDAEILTPGKDSPFKYGRDFDLGDKVDVVNQSWGLRMTAPITQMLEVYESSGFRLEATFGRARPTLISKLKDKFAELEGVEKQELPSQVAVQQMREAIRFAQEGLTEEERKRLEQAQANMEAALAKAEAEGKAAKDYADSQDEGVYQDSTIFTEQYAERQIPSQNTPPANPAKGDKWVDTSAEPPQMKIYDGVNWNAVKGDKGDPGSNAPLIKFDGTGQIFKVAAGGAVSPATLMLTGLTINTAITQWSYSINGGAFNTTPPAGVSRSGNTVTINGANMSAATIAVRASDGIVSDTFTIAKVQDGAEGAAGETGPKGDPGAAGAPGQDAYTVLLTNEAHTFPGSNSAAVAASVQTSVIAYKGTALVTPSSITVGTMPIGMTASVSGSTVTFSVTTAMTSASGTVALTIVVDGRTFTRLFSYAISYKGATGAQGPAGPKGDQGVQGPKGADGQTLYTWVKYADTPTTGMSDSPSGKTYIGLAYNKTTTAESANYADYSWSLIKGEQGVQGPKGADGETTYTWIRYADTETGTGMSASPAGKRFLGLAYNKTTPTPSSNAADYMWSPLFDNVVVGGRNYFVISEAKENTLLAWATGNESPELGSLTSGYIPVSAGDKFFVSPEGTSQLFYYDSSKVKVNPTNLIGGTTITVPNVESYKFMRVVFRGNFLNGRTKSEAKVKIEKGNIPTDWSPAPEDVQAEIEKAKEDAKNAQTSADGKNTVYRQATKPSAVGKKDGDLWFDTANGNRISILQNGVWAFLPLDHQALAVEKLSAVSANLGDVTAGNISGVTMDLANGKVVVDDKGNARFAGDITGASGTFGKVSAGEGEFTLQDPTTGLEFYAVQKQNIIRDHSFELVMEDWNRTDDESWTTNTVPASSMQYRSAWNMNGSPRVAGTVVPDVGESMAMYGLKAICVRRGHFVNQYITSGPLPGTVFTFSAHFKRQKSYAAGIPRIEVWHVSDMGVRKTRLLDSTFPRVPDDHRKVRHGASFSVPSNFAAYDMLEIVLVGGDDNWVQCDGVQVVEGDKPSVYMPEDSVWDIAHGNIMPTPPNGPMTIWNGVYQMTDKDIVRPSIPLSACPSGWILEWSRYTPGVGENNFNFSHSYIHKGVPKGVSNSFRVPITNPILPLKYLYFSDTTISGHASNVSSSPFSGDNREAVLRSVYAW